MLMKEGLIKYRGLFISTTLFIFFFIAFLAINSLQQGSMVEDVEYANIVQKLHDDIVSGRLSDQLVPKLKALETGGTIDLSQAHQVTVSSIGTYLKNSTQSLTEAISAIESKDQKLAMDKFGEVNEAALDKKNRAIKLSKLLAVAVGVLTFVLYFVVMIQIVLQISKTDDFEVQSRRETQGILSTLSEGVFLLDKDYQIGAEQSASLKTMFKSEKDLEGNFLDFISSYVTQKNIELAHEYLELLYGDRVKERLVEELNPLKEVEVNIVRRDGSYESHYLDFKFKRVMVDNKVSHLLGSVSDVTKRVMLERELDATKEAQEAQLDMLKSILYIDRKKLSLFFNNTNEILQEVNFTLESEGKVFSDEHIRVILNQIGSKIHQIKGDAAALGLHRFEFSAHDLEEIITNIKKENRKITGKDLFPLTSGLRMMFSDLEELTELVSKFSGIEVKSESGGVGGGQNQVAAEPEEYIDIYSSLMNICDTVSKRDNKLVRLSVRGLTPQLVPPHLASIIQTIGTQCIRNSIIHGVEEPSQRVSLGKSDVADIKVTFAGIDQGHMLTIRDDGRGIDEEGVMEKAIEHKLLPEDFSGTLSKSQVKSLLLNSGFSTREEADMDAGRGFGLDVIKRLVDDNGGKMSISYEKDAFFRISILFPFRTTYENVQKDELCA